MSFTLARPVVKPMIGTGVSCRTSVRKDGAVTFALNMTGQFQLSHFEGSIEGEFVKLEIGRANDAGLLKISIVDEEASKIVVSPSMKMAVRIKCAGWDTLGTEPNKSEPCTVKESGEGFVVLKLPSWANGQEKMASEFGLKSTKPAAA